MYLSRANIWQTTTNDYRSSCTRTQPSITDIKNHGPPVLLITKSLPRARAIITFPRLSAVDTASRIPEYIAKRGGRSTNRPTVSYCPRLLSNWHADRSRTKKGAGETGSPWDTVGDRSRGIRVGTARRKGVHEDMSRTDIRRVSDFPRY